MGCKFAGVLFYTKKYEVLKNSSPKELKWRPLRTFQVFLFFALFLASLFNFDAPSSKCSKKVFKNSFCDVKCSVPSNAARRIVLNIEEKPENRKNLSIFGKNLQLKNTIVNLPKLGKEVGNYVYF